MAKAETETEPKTAETKADKFKRLAKSRLNKALDAIANLGGLANTGNYEYTPEQVKVIFTHLENECNSLAARFRTPETQAEGRNIDL